MYGNGKKSKTLGRKQRMAATEKKKKKASSSKLGKEDASSMRIVPAPQKAKKYDTKAFDSSDFDDFITSSPVPARKRRTGKKKSFAFPSFLKSRTKSRVTASVASANNNLLQLKPTPMPVIIVTDIGADIDDTLALFVMLGASDAVKVVAVVTSVNNGLHRGAVTRGFLRLLGISDESVEILPSVDGCVAGCYIPDGFPQTNEACLGDLASTPRRIVEICKDHQETGVLLYGIASLTPVAEAIKLDLEGENIMQDVVKHVYLQGNAEMFREVDGKLETTKDPVTWQTEPVRIRPDAHAYNFKNDMDAATLVFDHFQDSTPFTLLGKYAAYRVPIKKCDFSEWTHKISRAWSETVSKNSEKVVIPNPPDLLNTAKRQMKRFRDGNPEKFDQIYKIPGNLSKEELARFEWFDTLPNDYVCSHPYDPLLGLRLIQDVRASQKTLFGDSKEKSKPLFEEYVCKTERGHEHVILGNIPTRNSIPDPDYVHDVLVEHISLGLAYHG